MTVTANRRDANNNDALRLDEFLLTASADAAIAIEPFARAIAGRSRRLAAHISSLPAVVDDPQFDLPVEFRQALQGDVQQLGARPLRAQLCELAARHVESALRRILERPAESFRTDPFATEPEQVSAPDLITKSGNDDPTIDPGHLDAWREFRQGVARLEPDLQQIVDLQFYCGLPAAAAAEVLAIPVDAVTSRWRAAKIQIALAGVNLARE